MACRNKKRGEAALREVRAESDSDDVLLLKLDMALQSSIRTFVKDLDTYTDTVDVLVHNAAAFDIAQKTPRFTEENVESIWATNHVGCVFLTHLLLEKLQRSEQGRVITVASQGLVLHPFLKVDLDDPEFKQRKFSVPKAYYQSKLAQVMYTYWLAERLKHTRVTANCVRVTNVKLDLARYPHLSSLNKFLYGVKARFSISPEQMAETYTYLASSDEVANFSGLYFDENRKPVKSSAYSNDFKESERVMKLTQRYLPEPLSRPEF